MDGAKISPSSSARANAVSSRNVSRPLFNNTAAAAVAGEMGAAVKDAAPVNDAVPKRAYLSDDAVCAAPV